MSVRNALACLALAASAVAIAGMPARAQAPAQTCAANDLRCRVDQLEARLNALESKQGVIEAKQKTAYVPPPPPAIEVLHVYQQCNPNCETAAAQLCAENGFISGKLKEWEHPRNGPNMLRSAECRRR